MSNTTTPTINTYISDMLALEQHITQPLQHQANDASVVRFAPAARVINEALAKQKARVDALQQRLEAVGGHAGSPIKSGVASALGAAAAAIGDARKTEVSKYLRDDYSALCLASAGYTLLHTTALALGDSATASLAQRHLTDTATTIMKISATLPVVCLAELREEGVAVDPSVATQAEQDVEKAWKDGSIHSN